MKQSTKNKIVVLLPWLLTLSILIISTLIGLSYKEGFNPFQAKFAESNLLSTMRIHLLEATEAEKNAVLAITDETSKSFADQAQRAAEAVESGRKEIETIIHQENFPKQIQLINEFNACWSQYRELDKTILDLATQNTNLKAQKISAVQCAEEMGRFDESLSRIIQKNKHGNQCNNAVSLSYEALTASLKIFALHKPHIEEANDQEMDKIEQRIKAYDESARKALNSLRGIAGLNANEDLKNADYAYNRFMNLTGGLLKLSRMNTNIKSAELSLGRKRLVSAQCQEILTTLHKTVQPQNDYTLPRLKSGNNNFGSTFKDE